MAIGLAIYMKHINPRPSYVPDLNRYLSDAQKLSKTYGHGTTCIKDHNYEILGGSHSHLIDAVDKEEHARKRKVMSAAFTIKNLEHWEYKVIKLTQRLLDAFDKLCTAPLPQGETKIEEKEPTLDFNKWIYLWTIEAINNIALSSTLGLLESGKDVVTADKLDGTLYKADIDSHRISPSWPSQFLFGTTKITRF